MENFTGEDEGHGFGVEPKPRNGSERSGAMPIARLKTAWIWGDGLAQADGVYLLA